MKITIKYLNYIRKMKAFYGINDYKWYEKGNNLKRKTMQRGEYNGEKID